MSCRLRRTRWRELPVGHSRHPNSIIVLCPKRRNTNTPGFDQFPRTRKRDGWMGGWVDEWMSGWVDGWMSYGRAGCGGCLDEWIDGFLDGSDLDLDEWIGGFLDGLGSESCHWFVSRLDSSELIRCRSLFSTSQWSLSNASKSFSAMTWLRHNPQP